MRKMIVGMALLCLMSAPAAGVNLLTNPGFEDDEPAPGDHVPDGWTTSTDDVYKELGDLMYLVDPRAGEDRIGTQSSWGTASESAESVSILPNGANWYELTLSFYTAFHVVGGNTNTATGQIVVDGVVVAEQSISATTDQAYALTQVSWAGPVATGIKVRFLMEADGSGGAVDPWGVIGIDDVSLEETQVPCSPQHAPGAILPVSIDNNSNTVGVISGTDMNQVTGAKLLDAATQTIEIPGANLRDQTTGSVTFDFATTGAPAGVYHVITMQTGCPSRALVNGFEITCPDPTVLTGASPDFVIPPLLGTEQITITGTQYLDQVASVSLVHASGSPTIDAILPFVLQSGTEIVASFDLSAAPPGLYDVVCDRTDGCSDVSLEDEIEIDVVMTGTNLLLNPGFDVVTNNAVNPDFPNDPLNETIWLGFNYPYGMPNAYCEYYQRCDEVANPNWCYRDCEDVVGCVEPDVDPTCCDARDPACMEVGAPEPCCCTDPCAGLKAYGGWGSRSHPEEPLGVYPEYQAWEAAASGGVLVTDTYQTVKVSVGATVTLGGFVHTGPANSGELNTITINVFDGPAASGTNLATTTIDQTLAAGGWYPFLLTTSPVTTEEYVTVHWQSTTNAPYGYAGAVHCEDFSLTSDQTCSLQHDLGTNPTVDPTGELPHDATTAVTITGDADRANMGQITSVKLIQVETETVIECTDVVATAATVSFNAPIGTETGGNPLGDYLILAEQGNCVGQTIVDGVTVGCADPTVFTAVTVPGGGNELQLPQGRVEMTITGSGLDELSDIWLELGQKTILGESPHLVGNDLVATFDLSGAVPGPYTLKATRPDACADPDPLAGAVRLFGIAGVNILLGRNGTFDDFGAKAMNAALPPAEGWTKDTSAGGFDLLYNSDIHNPGSPAPDDADEEINPGNPNWGSCKTGNGRHARVYQTITSAELPPAGGQQVYVLGWMDACSATNEANPNRNYDHYVRLYDGAVRESAYELVHFRLPLDAQCGPWYPVSAEALPTTDTVTIEWGYHVGSDDGWSTPATHVDELQLIVTQPCPKPYGDSDDPPDGDIDQEDFGRWQACYAGINQPYASGCECFDADGDLDIDDKDFKVFGGCATGADILQADDNCGDWQACCDATGSPGCSMRGKGQCVIDGGTSYDGEDCATFTCP